jgi:DNA mismatch repair protein MutS
MAKEGTDTPLMTQHRTIKQKYPDAILLFRVGDFYETFGEDAIRSSQVLGITLTKRNNGAAVSEELAGFPYHALDSYLHKLVRAGFRVAICDQLEDPKQAKGLVRRGVTELVTPGLATHDKLLDHRSNNYLAAIHAEGDRWGIAFLDISTGEFAVAEADQDYADKLLQTYRPAEVIFTRQYQKTFKETFGTGFHTYGLDSWIFDEAFAREMLLKQFQTLSLKGFGIEDLRLATVAAGAVLHYLKETEHPHLEHLTGIQRIERSDYLWMDRFTVRNLELLTAASENGKSLVQVLDHTVSPMGSRLLKRWILLPPADARRIAERLGAVEFLIREVGKRHELSRCLKACGDIERLVSKIPQRRISPRELRQLLTGLEQAESIKAACRDSSDAYVRQLTQSLDPCPEQAARIRLELAEQPPGVSNRPGIIRSGVNAELDELRAIESGGKQYLASMQRTEAEASGISSLKIGFNNVFGYYLEVTHAHRDKVPTSWIRKQTLANAERYITPELKTYEEKITGAADRILLLEAELYEALLLSVQEKIRAIQQNGQLLAILDCLTCFAQNALQFDYKKPQMLESLVLELSAARHPVIERNLPPGEAYIANDLVLDPESQQIIILTGPNMSGKSALLRQTALITIMAHMGSFVPADAAKIPLTDRVFTRVGASDNLGGGESTFMVEMNETASIINNITPRSLVLLDEIGRGTSTYDGISIAWSIAEFLHESPARPKTLFATHYHELHGLELELPRVKNFHISSRETGNKVIFLRKLVSGASTHSFGIQVARMAGMPASLIQRANEILRQLEESNRERPQTQIPKAKKTNQVQLTIFDAHTEAFTHIRSLLADLDLNYLTPMQALLKLQEIKALLK